MSDENRSSSVGQWGRPLRKRSHGPVPQPAASNPAPVGRVDDPPLVGGSPAVESPGAFLGSAPSVGPPSRREPDADDQRLRELVAFMARGLVDHPQDVQVDILASGSNASFEL